MKNYLIYINQDNSIPPEVYYHTLLAEFILSKHPHFREQLRCRQFASYLFQRAKEAGICYREAINNGDTDTDAHQKAKELLFQDFPIYTVISE